MQTKQEASAQNEEQCGCDDAKDSALLAGRTGHTWKERQAPDEAYYGAADVTHCVDRPSAFAHNIHTNHEVEHDAESYEHNEAAAHLLQHLVTVESRPVDDDHG